MSWMSHLIELRQRVLRSLLIFICIFAVLLVFAKQLYALLAVPLLIHLTGDQHLIATSVAAPFVVPMKFALIVAVFVSLPVFLYQIWAFVAPALYPHERRMLWTMLLLSVVLFYLGVMFAYSVVFPLMFRFFARMLPAGVVLMPDISQYLGFSTQLFFAFGVCFEVPVIIWLLVSSGLVSRDTLQAKRPYIIVLAFTLGMLLTPPDVLSQVLLAVPMWLLYELGLFLTKHAAVQSVDRETHISSS